MDESSTSEVELGRGLGDGSFPALSRGRAGKRLGANPSVNGRLQVEHFILCDKHVLVQFYAVNVIKEQKALIYCISCRPTA